MFYIINEWIQCGRSIKVIGNSFIQSTKTSIADASTPFFIIGMCTLNKVFLGFIPSVLEAKSILGVTFDKLDSIEPNERARKRTE